MSKLFDKSRISNMLRKGGDDESTSASWDPLRNVRSPGPSHPDIVSIEALKSLIQEDEEAARRAKEAAARERQSVDDAQARAEA